MLILCSPLAPDALAQVKKGLRGLFNRKKSKAGHQQQQQAEPESSTSPELPTDNTGGAAPTAPARVGDDTKNGSLTLPSYPSAPKHNQSINTSHHITGDYTQRAEAPTSSPAHHISEPSGMEEAKAVDLNPAPANIDTTTAPTQPAMKGVDEGSLAPMGTKAEPPSSTGMSATSGPLGDHMAEVYQEVDHTEEGGTTALESEGVKGSQ